MQKRVFVADIIDPKTDNHEADFRLVELENLVNTYGGLVIVQKIQKRNLPDYKTHIWSGKLDEIADEMISTGSDLLIFGNILKPRQIYAVNEILKKKSKETGESGFVISARDRIDLILKIFELHAHTEESRLQIELAAIKHMWPRIVGMAMELGRQWWGSKLARGVGETNTEIMKRHLKDRKSEVVAKIWEYQKMRKFQRIRRSRSDIFSVWIIWYTNAGKSSLFNSMSSKKVLSENKLFATLGTTAGKCFLDYDATHRPIEILLHDTIWFIRDLPPQLIDAFRSTLENSIETDLILHVIDASDIEIDKKIQIVDDILDEVGSKTTKLYVFNKIDLLTDLEVEDLKVKFAHLNPIFVSSVEKIGVADLKQKILTNINFKKS